MTLARLRHVGSTALGRLSTSSPARLLAPEWLRAAARPTPGPVPVERAVRAVIAVLTPVGLGLATGSLSITVLIGIGALIGSVVDRDVPYRQRIVRTGGAVLLGCTGWMIGRTTQTFGPTWLVVVVVAAVAVVSALISTAGAVASVASLQLLIMTSISSGRAFPGPVWQPGLLYLAGGAWALALSLLFGVGRRTVPERRAAAGVYAALGDQLTASHDRRDDDAEAARQKVTTALSDAYDTLLAVRVSEGGRDPTFRRLFALLNASTLVSEAATALLREGGRPPSTAVGAVRDLARAIRAADEPPAAPRWEPGSPAERHLRDALASVRGIVDGDHELAPSWTPPTLHDRIARVRQVVTPGPAGWRAAARLALCMVAAEVVSHVDTTQRSYWVPLTVALVLKPDLGSVFARGLQRGAGTVVGVLLGALVIEFVPVGPWMLLPMAAFAAVAPIGISRNYGMFSTFLTPLVLVLIDLISRLGTTLLVDRLVDSLVGVAIVLVLGYLIWPESWHVRLGARVADTVDGLGTYLHDALGAGTAERAAARRRAYRSLGDLRTGFQQAMTEPGPVGRQASAWWPAVVGLERTTDAITWTAAAVAAGSDPPPRRDLDAVVAVVDDLAATVREQRRPARLPLPTGDGRSGAVAIADELRSVRATLGGPPEDTGEEDTGEEDTGEPTPPELVGRVVDEDGRPVRCARVTATDRHGTQLAHTRADDRGVFRLVPTARDEDGGDDGGARLLLLTAPGHLPAARWAREDGPGDDVVLARTAPGR